MVGRDGRERDAASGADGAREAYTGRVWTGQIIWLRGGRSK